MKIIFVSKKSSKPKSISLNFFLFCLFAIILLNFILVIYYVDLKKTGSSNKYIGLQDRSLFYGNNAPKHLDVFVNQIGELHTRILQIDAQTERLQSAMKRQIIGKQKLPLLKKMKIKNGQGGPFINENLNIQDVSKALDKLLVKIEEREVMYNKMEAILLKQSVLKETLPTLYPVNVPYTSSSYGWRQDPLLGIRAFHAGLDFSAAHGEPIRATAGGIVVEASRARKYGKFVRIKHGGGLETRYAHASKLFVKKGDIIKKEDLIALVGNTGRSTGPHLHYEIRLNNRSLDPRQYIRK